MVDGRPENTRLERTHGRADERSVLPAGLRGDLNARIQRDRVALGFGWQTIQTIFDWVFECARGRVWKFGALRQQKIPSYTGSDIEKLFAFRLEN